MSRARPGRRPRDRETAWIDWIRRFEGTLPASRFPVGIGDDAAVWRPRPGRELVLTVDTQIEGTHFEPGWLTARDIGARAVTSSVSDLAAMGATPATMLVSLHVPHDLSPARFRALHTGIHDASTRYGIPIAGGNISRGPLAISITAIGEVEPGRALRRDGARPGDEIWVTGFPGLARLGLLRLAGRLDVPLRSPLASPALRAFRRPRARLREALAIRDRFSPTAMIDLSDGLGRDLDHLAGAARARRVGPIGFALARDAFAPLVPLSRLAVRAGLDVLETALAGGEDYELCFTARPGRVARPTVAAFTRRFDLPLTRVGQVIASEGFWETMPDATRKRLTFEGFEHLAGASE